MKIKPQIYAKTLVDSASSDNLKKVSRSFWHLLQKNKQYRDLHKILEFIDEEAAARENKILAKVYTKNALNEKDLNEIKVKLEKKFEKEIILQIIIGKNVTGVIVKVDGKIIDLTAENKINKLKKIFLN